MPPPTHQRQALLGIDVGSRYIGLAQSDASRLIGSPIGTHQLVKGKIKESQSSLFELIETKLEEEDVGGIVVGYPYRMDGSEGKACADVRNFVKLMQVSPF